jgi:hypothetical protein
LLWATLGLAHPFKIEVILSKRVDVLPKQRGREAQNIVVDHLAFSAELADYRPDVQRIPSLRKRWLEKPEAFTRREARGGQGFRAVTGLNLEYHRLAINGVAKLGPQVAAALENSRETDPSHLSSLGRALAAAAAKMEPQAAAEIAGRGAQRLAAALENPQETDPSRLSSLGRALAAVAAKMEPQAAAEIAGRGAQRLAAALENPQETDSDRLSRLGQSLAAVCRLLPSAHRTHLLALSNMLLQPMSKEAAEGKEQPYDRKLLAAVCAQLLQQDLTEVLKYPFCTGEAEQIVLLQLGTETGGKFGGNVWNFVEQAEALGIKDVGSPTKRPSVQEALNAEQIIGFISGHCPTSSHVITDGCCQCYSRTCSSVATIAFSRSLTRSRSSRNIFTLIMSIFSNRFRWTGS